MIMVLWCAAWIASGRRILILCPINYFSEKQVNLFAAGFTPTIIPTESSSAEITTNGSYWFITSDMDSSLLLGAKGGTPRSYLRIRFNRFLL